MPYSGYKQITLENWLEPDLLIERFVKLVGQEPPVPLTAEDWLQDILAIQLDDAVPDDVQALFECARACLVYGYFYYPLHSVGMQHVYKALEAAATVKCEMAGRSDKKGELQKKLRWLRDHGDLDSKALSRWDNIRKQRNDFAHPRSNCMLTPDMSIGIVRDAGKEIDALFGDA